jgi:PPIC-type PPIASE domain
MVAIGGRHALAVAGGGQRRPLDEQRTSAILLSVVSRLGWFSPVFVLLAVAALAGCGGGKSAGTSAGRTGGATTTTTVAAAASRAGPLVAMVGSTAITRGSLVHWTAVASDVPPGQPVDTRPSTLRPVLGRLIDLYAIVNQAGERHLTVSDGEARKALSAIEENESALLGLEDLDATGVKGTWLAPVWGERSLGELLESLGATTQDKLWLVKLAMLAERLRQKVNEEAVRGVGRARVARYYRQHIRDFGVPEKRDYEVFMTKRRPEAYAGRREIEAGTSFKVVAKLRNVSPEAHEGLVIGLERGRGEPAFEHYVFHTPAHVLMGPIEQALFYVFRVTKITPPTVRSLREVQGSIAARLAKRDVTTKLLPALQRNWAALASCQPGYETAGCRRKSAS